MESSSVITAGAMSSFNCEVCCIQLNSFLQWEQHISGTKHKKRVQNGIPVAKYIPEPVVKTSIAELLNSSSDNLPNSTYRCKICDDICTGIIPFQAHINGKKHLKKLMAINNSAPSLGETIQRIESCANTAAVNNPDMSSPAKDTKEDFILDAEESVRRAKNHNQQCYFEYPDDFPLYSINQKVALLNGHFGFIPLDQPVPELQKLFD